MVIPVKGIKAASGTTQGLLKEVTQKKIAYLLSKHTIKDVEVYSLIKEFFKEYLSTNYEFTFDELAEELKKTYIEKHVKEALFKLLKDFSTIEYKDEDIPQEVLRNVLMTLSKLVEKLIEEKEQRSFFSRLFSKKETKTVEPSAMPVAEQPRHHDSARTSAPSPILQAPAEKTETKSPSLTPPTDFSAEEPVSTSQNHSFAPTIEVHHFHFPAIDEDTAVPAPPSDASPAAPSSTVFSSAPETLAEKDHPFVFENVPPAKDRQHAIAAASSFSEDSAPITPFTVTASHSSGWTDDVDDKPLKKPVKHEEIVFVPQEKPVALPVQPVVTAPARAAPAPSASALPTPSPTLPPAPLPAFAKTPLSPEFSFGPEEQALSEDLEKLARELDLVIRDGENPAPQHATPSPAPAATGHHHHAHHPSRSVPELVTAIQQLIIESKMKEAHHLYKELLQRYNALPEQEKHQHYDQVHYLYSLLQN